MNKSDLIKWLRNEAGSINPDPAALTSAIAEIESLRTQVASLELKLKLAVRSPAEDLIEAELKTHMTMKEAKEECERWLAYLDGQKRRSIELQKLATDRRAGTCDDVEMRRRMAAIDRSITVYDGARLADAVRVLIAIA